MEAHLFRSFSDELQKIAVSLSGFTKAPLAKATSGMSGGLKSVSYSAVNSVPKAPNFGQNLNPPPLSR